MYFVWQEELCALHFSCGVDMKVSKAPRAVYEHLALHEKLWLGHFDLSGEENSPALPCRPAGGIRGDGNSRGFVDMLVNASGFYLRFSSSSGAQIALQRSLLL